MAAAGSPFGMRGIATIPAPRRPRLLVLAPDPVRDVRPDRAVETLGVAAVGGPVAAVAGPVATVAGPVAAVAGPCAAPLTGALTGAVPQRSQYPSTTVPPHPGSAHFMA